MSVGFVQFSVRTVIALLHAVKHLNFVTEKRRVFIGVWTEIFNVIYISIALWTVHEIRYDVRQQCLPLVNAWGM